ncbi:MAG: phosphoenolpyruvate--protein phosphotransferase, partial [Gemmatimonadota bacterium]
MNDDRVLMGIGVSPGVAFGPAVVVRLEFPDVPDRTVTNDQIEAEVARLHDAVDHVVRELEDLRDRMAQRAGPEESGIFDAQMMMAKDEDFLRSVETLIRNNQLSAETAYEFKGLELREAWSGSGNARLRERLADLTAVQRRILERLMGRPDGHLFINPTDEHVIVVAHELSPGLTVQLDRERVVGLVSVEGTRTSHAAILAHSLGIPAVMGAAGALERITPGATLLVDGQTGVIIIDPTPEELDEARTRITRRRKLELELEGVAGEPPVTSDGRPILLQGNVDLPEEIESAIRFGAQGVGLLRTEFLITGRTSLPGEDEQAEYFRRVAGAFPGYPIIVRSFDLGGDKFPAAFQAPPEANPFLGWRSIRVCLDHPEILRTQIRAVLRAAADRDVQLMLPLITALDEVVHSRE